MKIVEYAVSIAPNQEMRRAADLADGSLS